MEIQKQINFVHILIYHNKTIKSNISIPLIFNLELLKIVYFKLSIQKGFYLNSSLNSSHI